MLGACRVQETLRPPEDVVYQYLLEQLVFNEGGVRLPKEATVFVGVGRPLQAQDPSGETMQVLSRIWPVRKISEATPLSWPSQNRILDRKTGHQGWLIWAAPVQGDGPDKIHFQGGMFSDGTAYKECDFYLIRGKKGWVIVDAKMTGMG